MRIITTLLLLLATVAVGATRELPIAPVHAFLRKYFPTFSIYLLSFLDPLSADSGIMFIDEIYGSQRTEGIQYDTGSTGNPASGSIDLYLDIYEPTGTNLPEK